MRFQLTPESQARFKRGLHATAQKLNKSTLDLLRQTAVYYAQAARKRTPGPIYGSKGSTMKERTVTKIPGGWTAGLRTPKGKVALYQIDAWIGPIGNKRHVMWNSKRPQNIMRYIRYRGAAQVSWNSMLQQLFGKSTRNDRVHFPHVDSVGSIVRLYSPKNFQTVIDTENRLGYIARLRPGIAAEALLSAENRIASAYIKKMGGELNNEWNK